MKDTMTSIRKTASILILSLTAAVAGQAMAAEPASGLTRAQVLADLAEAQRSGNIIEGEIGLPLNVLNPQQYPAQQQAAGATRAQVIAEFQRARANGELLETVSGARMSELRPDLYPAKTAQGQAVSRDQVVADLQRARAAGELNLGEGS